MSLNSKILFTTQPKINYNFCYKSPFFPVINREMKLQTIGIQQILKIVFYYSSVILPVPSPVPSCYFPDSPQKLFYT